MELKARGDEAAGNSLNEAAHRFNDQEVYLRLRSSPMRSSPAANPIPSAQAVD